jgi:hypothetical protein
MKTIGKTTTPTTTVGLNGGGNEKDIFIAV